MKKPNNYAKIIFLFFLIQWISCAKESFAPENDWHLGKKLADIPFTKISTEKGNDYYPQVYKIMIRQPIDHKDTSKGFFWQKLYLAHKGFERPMALITEGYSAPYHYISEIANFTQANQLIVEHRYFGESKPDSILWSYLNLEQAAADLHHIKESFSKIYTKAWLSSGISKGGQTTVAYKYFYPQDVVVAIPYVAPLTFAREDPRVPEFIASKAGNEKSRKKIADLQLLLLQNKQKLLPEFEKLAESKGWTFNNVGGLESAFEHGVLELSFVIWQWGYDVDKMPDKIQPTDSLFSFLSYADPFSFFSDDEAEKLKPYFYQALTEIGIYTYETKSLLPYLKFAQNPDFEFTLQNLIPIPYSNQSNLKINQWIKDNGNNFIYIYGNYDPWYAAGIEPDTLKTNSFSMILPGGSHRTRLHSFGKSAQNKVRDSLSIWLDVEIISENK